VYLFIRNHLLFLRLLVRNSFKEWNYCEDEFSFDIKDSKLLQLYQVKLLLTAVRNRIVKIEDSCFVSCTIASQKDPFRNNNFHTKTRHSHMVILPLLVIEAADEVGSQSSHNIILLSHQQGLIRKGMTLLKKQQLDICCYKFNMKTPLHLLDSLHLLLA